VQERGERGRRSPQDEDRPVDQRSAPSFFGERADISDFSRQVVPVRLHGFLRHCDRHFKIQSYLRQVRFIAAAILIERGRLKNGEGARGLSASGLIKGSQAWTHKGPAPAVLRNAKTA